MAAIVSVMQGEERGSSQEEEARCALEIPNSIHDAVLHVLPLISRLRSQLDDGGEECNNYELELRFGYLQHNATTRFVPGINFDTMRQIENMLNSFKGWDRYSRGWVYMQDYFYQVEGKQYRTSTTFDVDAQDGQGGTSCVHIFKTILARAELRGLPLNSAEILKQMQQLPVVCDLRLSLAHEKRLAASEIPPLVQPHMLRFKQRRSFEVRGWRFDLTKTWQAANREEMEQKQTHDPVCEFEIECVDPMHCLQKPYHTDEYVATSLLLKALDFMTVKGLEPVHVE